MPVTSMGDSPLNSNSCKPPPPGNPRGGSSVDPELLVAAGCGGLQDPLVGAVVLDGFPLHLPAEQRHQGDGDVGQHEDV